MVLSKPHTTCDDDVFASSSATRLSSSGLAVCAHAHSRQGTTSRMSKLWGEGG